MITYKSTIRCACCGVAVDVSSEDPTRSPFLRTDFGLSFDCPACGESYPLAARSLVSYKPTAIQPLVSKEEISALFEDHDNTTTYQS